MQNRNMEKKAGMEMKQGRFAAGKRLVTMICTVFMIAVCWGNMVFASNYAENFATSMFLENLKWIVILGIIVGCFLGVIKRNYTGILITLIGGGIILFFVSNPTKIVDIGTTIGGAVFK